MTAVLVMSTVLLGPQCMAQVLTTVEEAGPADCVYIAGNPDLYPIEYYDSEQQCYRGILPELLGMVAEDTGISFAYVNAGSERCLPPKRTAGKQRFVWGLPGSSKRSCGSAL